MELNLIAFAIPFFFGLIGLELLVARAKGQRVYRLDDAITDLGCGIGQQVTSVFSKVLSLGLYIYIFEYWAPFQMSSKSPGAWIIAILGLDFLYYWWHRWSHEINFMWAAHVVHHQSQDYNLAVALRQAWFTTFTNAPIYALLAFVGVPPALFLISESISLLYQFWIHTQLIPKLGPLEWVLNTPSHHRVHHGINPRYLDKNYAAILIVWDRVFGTFEEETEPVVYGTVKPYKSWNALWANFDYWAYLWTEAKSARTMTDTFKVFVKDPLWRPAGRPPYPVPPEVHPDTFQKWKTRAPRWVGIYVLLHFPLVAALTMGILLLENSAATGLLVVMAAFSLLSLFVWGLMLERREVGADLELIRLIGVGAVVTFVAGWAFPAVVALIWIWVAVSAYVVIAGRTELGAAT